MISKWYPTGVPWIFELVTSVIAAESGYDKTCGIRLVLDLANLLAVSFLFCLSVFCHVTIFTVKYTNDAVKGVNITLDTP